MQSLPESKSVVLSDEGEFKQRNLLLTEEQRFLKYEISLLKEKQKPESKSVMPSESKVITAEEFIREKIREKHEIKGQMNALWKYEVNGEDALRWAHEFKELNLSLPKQPEESKTEWISVDERLPNYGDRVLVYCQSITYYVKWSENINDILSYINNTDIKITHSMPLPKSPEVKTKQ